MFPICINPITNEVEALQTGLVTTRDDLFKLGAAVSAATEAVATHADEITRVSDLVGEHGDMLEETKASINELHTRFQNFDERDKAKSDEVATLLKALDDLSKDVRELKNNYNTVMEATQPITDGVTDDRQTDGQEPDCHSVAGVSITGKTESSVTVCAIDDAFDDVDPAADHDTVNFCDEVACKKTDDAEDASALGMASHGDRPFARRLRDMAPDAKTVTLKHGVEYCEDLVQLSDNISRKCLGMSLWNHQGFDKSKQDQFRLQVDKLKADQPPMPCETTQSYFKDVCKIASSASNTIMAILSTDVANSLGDVTDDAKNDAAAASSGVQSVGSSFVNLSPDSPTMA